MFPLSHLRKQKTCSRCFYNYTVLLSRNFAAHDDQGEKYLKLFLALFFFPFDPHTQPLFCSSSLLRVCTVASQPEGFWGLSVWNYWSLLAFMDSLWLPQLPATVHKYTYNIHSFVYFIAFFSSLSVCSCLFTHYGCTCIHTIHQNCFFLWIWGYWSFFQYIRYVLICLTETTVAVFWQNFLFSSFIAIQAQRI